MKHLLCRCAYQLHQERRYGVFVELEPFLLDLNQNGNRGFP
jgi:hypothetical protein